LRRLRPLIAVITAFTVAHSVTLIASAYDMAPGALWFPPLVETLIAASIVYMALENIVSASGGQRGWTGRGEPPTSASITRRWILAFGFGLVHGFGFSFALRQTLQFAGSHLVTSLLAFNAGVELGQLVVLAVLVPALAMLFRFVVAERVGTILLSALVAHTGWHWMVERADRFRQYSIELPALTAPFVLMLLQSLTAVVALAAILWLIFTIRMRQRGVARLESGSTPTSGNASGLSDNPVN
jgi:hypothetical protein